MFTFLTLLAYAAALATCTLRAFRIARSLPDKTDTANTKRWDDVADCGPAVLGAVAVFSLQQPWIIELAFRWTEAKLAVLYIVARAALAF